MTINPCEYLASCGGCQVRQDESLSSHQKRKSKRIEPIKLLFGEAHLFWTPKELQFYRPKVEWRLRWTENKVSAGYFKTGSRDFLPVDTCVIAHGLCNKLLHEFQQFSSKTHLAHKARLVLQVVENEQQLIAKLICPKEDRGDWECFVRWICERSYVLSCSINQDAQSASLQEETAAVKIWTKAGHFRQGHIASSDFMRGQIKKWLPESPTTRLLELFCGNGNLTRPLPISVAGFDSEPAAIDLANTELSEGSKYSVLNCFKELPEQWQDYDAILVDPPRSGLGEMANELSHFRKNVFIYISCDPESFLKDWAYFDRQGARVKEWVLLDMLPWTNRWEMMFLVDLG